MADYFWGRIEIGGDLHQTDLSRFCTAARIEPFDVPELLEEGRLALENEQASCGQFDELEDLCRELGLPYVRRSDGKYEFSPEIVFWVPGMEGPDAIIADHEGNMQVAMDDVQGIRDSLREGNLTEALALAEQTVVELPVLPRFRIITQGDTPEQTPPLDPGGRADQAAVP